MPPRLIIGLISLLTAATVMAPTARADGPAQARPDPRYEPAPTLYYGLGGGVLASPVRGFAASALGLAWPIVGPLALDVQTGMGSAPRDPSEQGDLWIRLAAGARLELPNRPLRPYVTLRVTHIHMAPLQVWSDHPFAAIAGDATYGLAHRTGLALSGGAMWSIPGAEHWQLGGDLEGEWVINGAGPSWFVALQVQIAYAFR